MNKKAVEFLIEVGSDITGSSIGSIIGCSVSGPMGAIVGATGGKVVECLFSKLGSEIQNRVLSKRESAKIGATVTYALDKMNKKFKDGECIRKDDFFDENSSGRSSADEIIEGMMFTVQREHEEKKLKYYGNLIANINFNESIKKDEANYLVAVSKKLSYRQLKLISIFARNLTYQPEPEVRKDNYLTWKEFNEKKEDEIIFVLQEVFELYNMGLVGTIEVPEDLEHGILSFRTSANYWGNGVTKIKEINPSKVIPQGIGWQLYRLMELWDIDKKERFELVRLLK